MEISETRSDPLLELERRIARRADELSLLRGPSGKYPLISWLEAEMEILRDEARCSGAFGHFRGLLG